MQNLAQHVRFPFFEKLISSSIKFLVWASLPNCSMKNLHQKHFFIDTFKNLLKFYKGVIQKVCSLRRGGGGGAHWKVNKDKWGGRVLACVYVRFFKKMLRFSKLSFIVILEFLLLIIKAVWNIKETVMKGYNIQSCQ